MLKASYLIITLAISLFGCGGAGDSTQNSEQHSALSSTQLSSAPSYQYSGTVESTKSITSGYTGITYPYHIYLPVNYATSNKSYSIIYATDGQWTFNYFSQVIDSLGKPFILASIEEGPAGSNQRATDYTPIGASLYIQFLKNELVPLIQSNYRTNNERTYVGTSYGGLLGSILLSRENIGQAYFKNYLLFDGSFWSMSAGNLQDEDLRYTQSKTLPVHLILTSANSPGNEVSVTDYQNRYSARHYEGILIDRKFFNIAHNDVANPSFDWAINLIE